MEPTHSADGFMQFRIDKNPPIETVGFCALIGNLESVPNRSTLVCSEPTKCKILLCRVGGFWGAVIGDLFLMCSDAVGVSFRLVGVSDLVAGCPLSGCLGMFPWKKKHIGKKQNNIEM